MTLHITARGLKVDAALRTFVQRRADFALRRFDARVARVAVRLSELDEAKGGMDRCCRLQATLRPGGRVVVEVIDSELEPAIRRAVDRLARLIAEHLMRHRTDARPR